ncbi:MAG TPA: DNA repair protein RecN [Parasegetibacter sp.]
MLAKLQVRNYAIIDELTINFSSGLNIITGETGAGKSILMGALSLILGDRADTASVMDKSKKCIVEGVFSAVGSPMIQSFLATNDLDEGDEITVRREIASGGKSRAFINDTPVNLEQLRTLSLLLVDLHRQFDTLELGDRDFQRKVIDALAGNQTQLQKYSAIYTEWKEAQQELEGLVLQQQKFEKEHDYNRFLFEELDELNLQENELENLEEELKVLSNAEGIKAGLNRAVHELSESDTPMVQQLKMLTQQLQSYASVHTGIAELVNRLHSVQVELHDIALELERVNDHIIYDAARIEQINERISSGYRLLKKHGLQTTSELIAIRDGLNEKLQAVLNIDGLIRLKSAEVEKLQDDLTVAARKLSEARKNELVPFEKKVNELLHKVGMPNARIKVTIDAKAPDLYGADAIDFLFDANSSGRFEPVRKVASGGELSRLMLCIKSLVAASIDLPSLIFDEIDTGISGEAARRVGEIMQQLSVSRQVICITHQPQIAGRASAHYYVYKEKKGNEVKTNIRELNKEERVNAIATMLGGEKPSAAAIANAREILQFQ